MQPMRYLINWLDQNANGEHYLFASQDLRCLLPELSDTSFKTLLSRAAKSGYLTRVCRGLYTYKKAIPPTGLFLFHVAARLRANEFNYISLETVLSDAGVISQIPINLITIMSSGRSNVISCKGFGTIEFIHTSKKPTDVMHELSYDFNCGLWRASVSLALNDMNNARRNTDLIDWKVADELIR